MKISPTPPEINFNSKSIEKLLNDSAYKELIQISANFNTRLRHERKLRFPFLDSQTGICQKHSNLYMKKTQRIPGLREGQIYTYPSVRWRNKRNSFLKLSNRPFFRFRANDNCTTTTSSNPSLIPLNHTSTTVTSNSNGIALPDDNSQVTDIQAIIDAESNSLTGGGDTDSNSQEVPKEWYYDDMDANDGVSEEQQDSDFDYNVNGYKRKKKGTVRKSTSRKPKDSFGMFGSESSEKSSSSRNKRSAGGGSSRSNRSSKKGTSSNSRSSKSSKNEKSSKASPPLMYDEPPSFDSVQGDLKLDGSSDSFAYRKY